MCPVLSQGVWEPGNPRIPAPPQSIIRRRVSKGEPGGLLANTKPLNRDPNAAGDTIMPTPRGATFMYSYPNMLPLPAAEVSRMSDAIESLRFDQLRGSFAHKVIWEDARGMVLRSAALYIGLLDGTEKRQYF